MSETAEIVDIPEMLASPEQLIAFFHTVSRLLPDSQVVVSVPPEMPAREALSLMHQHEISSHDKDPEMGRTLLDKKVGFHRHYPPGNTAP